MFHFNWIRLKISNSGINGTGALPDDKMVAVNIRKSKGKHKLNNQDQQ